jgi:2-polyprenyl-3-methyl-5-hydroxy-6-metoxy-1,4-benzoquinol methylase
MSVEERYRERYQAGDSPWDIGQPDFNLIDVVTQTPIRSCKVLEVGCGAGDNAIWLAQNGFEVMGIDTSEIALGKAKEKASQADVECQFMLVDFLKNTIAGAPFGFIFDRGCFHSLSHFGSIRPNPPRAWRCLLRKRPAT